MNLDEIEAGLAELSLADEGRRFTVRQKLQQLDRRLKGMLKEGDDPRVLVAYARCASLSQLWETAVARWSKVRAKHPDYQDVASLELARSYSWLGNHQQARQNFSRLSKAFMKKREARKCLQMIQRRERMFAAKVLTELLLDDYGFKNEATARSLMHATLLLRGVGTKYAENITCSILRTLARIDGRDVAMEAKPGFKASLKAWLRPFFRRQVDLSARLAKASTLSPVPVFLCGLGWSGSGALHDYLRQFPEVATTFGGSEVKIFEGKGGVKDLLAATDWRPVLKEFVLRRVWGFVADSGISPAKAYNQSLVKHVQKRKLLALAKATERLVTRVMHDNGNSLEDNLACWLREVIALAAPGGYRYCLLNNWLHGQNAALAHSIPGAKVFVVVRDPRDQFVDYNNQTDRKKKSAKAFVKEMQAKLTAVIRAAEDSKGWRSSLTLLRFEDFVLKSRLRLELAADLGIDDPAMPNKHFFNPEDSKKNINIHLGYSKNNDLDYIMKNLAAANDALGGLCFPK
ncbi:hypothetical protein [Desulfurivibrio alkaliphilus]|uniref:Sulfotransferase n=1 Tax=Desulfurivibrio alkaliphilus (strain DSM 19089 / UNIQEM U267 / AHT2) TaxID=589865 RepID=D6Z4M3_DESAT|nr:hypothetical protein [Desulfurivibrio alkaliphilus]ADH86498.1 hypothetical protein DaAHT2_1807 [Desulfurivibrio alkaliphilus AHT 2]